MRFRFDHLLGLSVESLPTSTDKGVAVFKAKPSIPLKEKFCLNKTQHPMGERVRMECHRYRELPLRDQPQNGMEVLIRVQRPWYRCLACGELATVELEDQFVIRRLVSPKNARKPVFELTNKRVTWRLAYWIYRQMPQELGRPLKFTNISKYAKQTGLSPKLIRELLSYPELVPQLKMYVKSLQQGWYQGEAFWRGDRSMPRQRRPSRPYSMSMPGTMNGMRL